MLHKSVLLLALLASPVQAQVYIMPQIPDDDLKIEALKLAYQMNGNSMVLYNGMIDLTTPFPTVPQEQIRTIPIEPTPTTPKADKIKPEKRADAAPADVCAKNGLRKVTHGRSWSCKR